MCASLYNNQYLNNKNQLIKNFKPTADANYNNNNKKN